MTKRDDEQTQIQWRSYVLLPADDVPRAGSRTEIVVTPNECLRVDVRVGDDGLLQFKLVE